MFFARSRRVTSSLIFAATLLGAGCAPDLDASDGEQAATQDDLGEPSEARPSTHPIDALEQAVEPPADEAPQGEVAPPAQAEPSGRTDACGEVPAGMTRDDAGRRSSAAPRSIHNWVQYTATLESLLTRLQTKLTVPPKPPPSGTVFLWPGVEPIRGPNWAPILKGVLQPVLTWGPSCAAGSPRGYDSWWISGMYVNISTTLATHRSCHGGPIMRVNVGDVLDLDIAQAGTVWKQTIKNLTSGQQVDYAIDMKGQEQGWALFDVELPTSNKPVADSVYTETVLTFASPLTAACAPSSQGANDFVSRARLSADRTKCCIDRITVRAPGVKATTTP